MLPICYAGLLAGVYAGLLRAVPGYGSCNAGKAANGSRGLDLVLVSSYAEPGLQGAPGLWGACLYGLRVAFSGNHDGLRGAPLPTSAGGGGGHRSCGLRCQARRVVEVAGAATEHAHPLPGDHGGEGDLERADWRPRRRSWGGLGGDAGLRPSAVLPSSGGGVGSRQVVVAAAHIAW